MAGEAFEAIKAGLDDAIAYAKGDATRGEASVHEKADGVWSDRIEADPTVWAGSRS